MLQKKEDKKLKNNMKNCVNKIMILNNLNMKNIYGQELL